MTDEEKRDKYFAACYIAMVALIALFIISVMY